MKCGIYNKGVLKQLAADKNSCITVTNSILSLSIHPSYTNNIKEGIRCSLNGRLKKYDDKLQGILLGYSNVKVDISGASFCGRKAYISYPVHCDCYVFRPYVGCVLKGLVNNISPDHIGCLVHQYVNARILRPEEESCEEWANRHVNFGDTISFRVKMLDFISPIPCIEGDFNLVEVDRENEQTPDECRTRNELEQDAIEELFKSTFEQGRTDRRSSLLSSTQIQSLKEADANFDCLSPITKSEKEKTSPPKKKKKKMKSSEMENPTMMLNSDLISRLPHGGKSQTEPLLRKEKRIDPIEETLERVVKNSKDVYEFETPTSPNIFNSSSPYRQTVVKRKGSEATSALQSDAVGLGAENYNGPSTSNVSQTKSDKKKKSSAIGNAVNDIAAASPTSSVNPTKSKKKKTSSKIGNPVQDSSASYVNTENNSVSTASSVVPQFISSEAQTKPKKKRKSSEIRNPVQNNGDTYVTAESNKSPSATSSAAPPPTVSQTPRKPKKKKTPSAIGNPAQHNAESNKSASTTSSAAPLSTSSETPKKSKKKRKFSAIGIDVKDNGASSLNSGNSASPALSSALPSTASGIPTKSKKKKKSSDTTNPSMTVETPRFTNEEITGGESSRRDEKRIDTIGETIDRVVANSVAEFETQVSTTTSNSTIVFRQTKIQDCLKRKRPETTKNVLKSDEAGVLAENDNSVSSTLSATPSTTKRRDDKPFYTIEVTPVSSNSSKSTSSLKQSTIEQSIKKKRPGATKNKLKSDPSDSGISSAATSVTTSTSMVTPTKSKKNKKSNETTSAKSTNYQSDATLSASAMSTLREQKPLDSIDETLSRVAENRVFEIEAPVSPSSSNSSSIFIQTKLQHAFKRKLPEASKKVVKSLAPVFEAENDQNALLCPPKPKKKKKSDEKVHPSMAIEGNPSSRVPQEEKRQINAQVEQQTDIVRETIERVVANNTSVETPMSPTTSDSGSVFIQTKIKRPKTPKSVANVKTDKGPSASSSSRVSPPKSTKKTPSKAANAESLALSGVTPPLKVTSTNNRREKKPNITQSENKNEDEDKLRLQMLEKAKRQLLDVLPPMSTTANVTGGNQVKINSESPGSKPKKKKKEKDKEYYEKKLRKLISKSGLDPTQLQKLMVPSANKEAES